MSAVASGSVPRLAPTVASLHREVRARLDGVGADADLEALELLAGVAGIARATVYAHPERRVEPAVVAAISAALARRCAGEPIAYITGRRGFHAIELAVDCRVLVPRPETELLVDAALASTPRHADASVLDLGTGSGAVALAIAAARGDVLLTAVDVSRAALEVALGNAERLALTHRVRWLESDWFASVGDERFDSIVCNPPYVRSGDAHMHELCYEPRSALDGGTDGLDAIRVVLAGAGRHLRANGALLLEHGFDQAGAVADLARAARLAVERVVRDLGGHERMTVLRVR